VTRRILDSLSGPANSLADDPDILYSGCFALNTKGYPCAHACGDRATYLVRWMSLSLGFAIEFDEKGSQMHPTFQFSLQCQHPSVESYVHLLLEEPEPLGHWSTNDAGSAAANCV
jgi:hypothetical protein